MTLAPGAAESPNVSSYAKSVPAVRAVPALVAGGGIGGSALVRYLAEAGQQVGAIQVAGTVSNEQVPFFITTCDYTVIGEELYAVSAYLTREPVLLGSLRGQDVAKLVIFGLVAAGVLLATFGQAEGYELRFSRWLLPGSE